MNKICAIIPVYNNEKTIKPVVCGCQKFIETVIVIDDGSTDKTSPILSEIPNIIVYKFTRNTGKGAAIKKGFEIALQNGFSHAITVDADGQHFPEWIETAIGECEKNPDSILIGARIGKSVGEFAPKKNMLARKFANLWIKIYTGFSLNDTQSGFRVYPVEKMKNIKFKTARFEFEQEVLVKSAWENINIGEFAIAQFYQSPQERISHYRAFRDSMRISWFFTETAFMKIKKIFIGELKSNASPRKAALSLALGVFLGILPIYGFQMPSAVLVACVMKLNLPLAALGTMISIPPMIPIIVFAAVRIGSAIFPSGIQDIASGAKIFVVGSVILAFLAGIVTYLIVYPICLAVKKRQKRQDFSPASQKTD